MAWYTDKCLSAGEAGWMIAGVSMRSAGVRDQLAPQDCLYTLTEKSADGDKVQLIGAVAEVLLASTDREAIIARMAAPECRIVSFTVTEKGYCRTAQGDLDLELAGAGFYPLVAEALAARQKAGLPGLTLLSCDNLAENGKQLARLMEQWIAANMPDLADWFRTQCTAPESMVDRIVPATTDAELAEVEAQLGLRDAGAVFTEPFSQWVIEDRFANGRPGWETHGVQLVDAVAPYETAKLRMLNGAHSLLAYAGLDAGHTFVHQAVGDPRLRGLAEQLMQDAIATITPGAGQDLVRYAGELIDRFANPALNHRLEQIAMDGSQKIPQRWLATLAIRQERGLQSEAILTGIAAWLRHVKGDRRRVDDPLAGPLAAAWDAHGREGIVEAIFGPDGLLGANWSPDQHSRSALLALI